MTEKRSILGESYACECPSTTHSHGVALFEVCVSPVALAKRRQSRNRILNGMVAMHGSWYHSLVRLFLASLWAALLLAGYACVDGSVRAGALDDEPLADSDDPNSSDGDHQDSDKVQSSPCGSWDDQLLAADCAVDPIAYARIAAAYDASAIVDYRFGPTYADVHLDDPEGSQLATLWGALDRGMTDAWYAWQTTIRPPDTYSLGGSGWYSNSGQLLYVPDDVADHCMGLARAFASYFPWGTDGHADWHVWDTRISWEPAGGDWYLTNPDYSMVREPVVTGNEGVEPTRPVAIARANAQRGMIGVVVYKNGLIAAARNDPHLSQYNAFARLPPGKVPTAVAVTPTSEFALVTTWDPANMIGELFVVAIRGRLVGTHEADENVFEPYGLSNWFYVVDLKVIGSVQLPFKAPTAVATGLDQTLWFDGRNGNIHVGNITDQAVRDNYANSGDLAHTLPRAGYAIVASRAENKVTFVDLQPLYTFYRMMYLTTQENFDATQALGAASNQWPYTFDYRPQQKPVIAFTINVLEPSAVAAGIPRLPFWSTNDDMFKSRAFIATLGGDLLVYDVGGLVTTAPTAEPVRITTIAVGKNPTSITFGAAEWPSDVMWLTSRADRAVYRLNSDGSVINVLRDARMKDPVYAFTSQGYGIAPLSVMDFRGKQALTYLTADLQARINEPQTEDSIIRVGNGAAPFEFANATAIPGKPFAFPVCEVY